MVHGVLGLNLPAATAENDSHTLTPSFFAVSVITEIHQSAFELGAFALLFGERVCMGAVSPSVACHSFAFPPSKNFFPRGGVNRDK